MHDPDQRAGSGLTSPAAEQLRIRATAVSAVCGRPGFVPEEYLDELDGDELGHPGADPWVLAAELCGAGIWERVEGGYRVLDEEAVQVCVDRVRELREQDAWLAGLPDPARSEPAVGAAGTTRFGDRIPKGAAASFRCGECGEIAGVVRVSRGGSNATTAARERAGTGWSWTTFSARSCMRTRAMSWTRFRRSSSRGTSIRSPSRDHLGTMGHYAVLLPGMPAELLQPRLEHALLGQSGTYDCIIGSCPTGTGTCSADPSGWHENMVSGDDAASNVYA